MLSYVYCYIVVVAVVVVFFDNNTCCMLKMNKIKQWKGFFSSLSRILWMDFHFWCIEQWLVRCTKYKSTQISICIGVYSLYTIFFSHFILLFFFFLLFFGVRVHINEPIQYFFLVLYKIQLFSFQWLNRVYFFVHCFLLFCDFTVHSTHNTKKKYNNFGFNVLW